MNAIKAWGSYNKNSNCWDINLSSILTQLIFDSAKYCDRYASDLFIEWEKVRRTINNIAEGLQWKFEFEFGFRECGIDSNYEIEYFERNPARYRKFRTLTITVDKNGIMEAVLK